MRVILVTGATGFLGKHLVEQLRNAEPGARLRVLCRGVSPWDQDPRVEVVCGNITSASDVAWAAEGVTEIYHLAGRVARQPKDSALLYRTHVEGTRNVCEAALRHGARKIVVVSSSGTIAVGREPVAHDETAGYKHEIVGEWPYYLSKIFAEKLALKYFTDQRSSTRDIALFLEGQILAVPLGGLNFVDARDAAAGLIAAMRSGRAGERYLLGGVNWSFRQLIGNVARVSGARSPKLQPSLRVSLWSAAVLRLLLPLVGKSFELDEASIKMSALFWYCDSSKARAKLGFTSRDPAETLKDTVDDLRRRP